MNYSDAALRQLTEACEGFRLAVYLDPIGIPTVGAGHVCRDLPVGTVITQEQAESYLRADIASAEDAVNRLVKIRLTQHQFDALVDFTFNVGAGNFAKSTLLVYVNMSQFAQADAEFAKWTLAAGHRLPGLVKRRTLEANWFDLPS